VVVAAHHDQLVRRQALLRDVPRLARAAEPDAAALAYGVEGEPDVLADPAAILVDDRPGGLRQVAVQELAERPLANEADAGRILLGVVRQPRLARDAAHVRLPQLAEREERARELRLGQAMQEVALVLAGVAALEQAVAPVRRDARVVPGGDPLGAEAHRMVEERLELDLGVAQHVRVGRAARRVLAQELGEHPVLVLGGEVHRLELDADHVRRGGRVDQVLPGRAVLVVVIVLPVLHEQADHLVAGALEQQRGDRRIDAA
jgi:hypothetical protein